MALQTSHKWLIGIAGILALAAIAYVIYKMNENKDVVPPPPVDTTTTHPGFLDTAQAAYCKIFPKSKLCGGPGKGGIETDPCAGVICNPAHVGWDIDGLYNNCCS